MGELSAVVSFIGFLGLVLIVGIAALPRMTRFLLDHHMTESNYTGAVIPIGMGLFLWFMLMACFLLTKCWALLHWPLPETLLAEGYGPVQERFQTMTLALTAIFVLGWIDDTIGNTEVKGFSGHLSAWMRDRTITTGLVKAAGVAIVSLWIAVETGGSIAAAVVHFCLLVFMTNAINLLDLRPGRACKAFILLAVLLLGIAPSSGWVLYLLPLVVSVVLLFPGDVKARAMLGDTGANFLGFGLGFCYIIAAPLWWQIGLTVLLVLMHWFAERGSISQVIERNRWLHWIDRWGRT